MEYNFSWRINAQGLNVAIPDPKLKTKSRKTVPGFCTSITALSLFYTVDPALVFLTKQHKKSPNFPNYSFET